MTRKRHIVIVDDEPNIGRSLGLILEGAGFPKLSMFWVWSLMGGTWAAVAGLRCLVSR